MDNYRLQHRLLACVASSHGGHRRIAIATPEGGPSSLGINQWASWVAASSSIQVQSFAGSSRSIMTDCRKCTLFPPPSPAIQLREKKTRTASTS